VNRIGPIVAHACDVEAFLFARTPAFGEEQLKVVVDTTADPTGEHERRKQADHLLRHLAGPQALNHGIGGDLVHVDVRQAVLDQMGDAGTDPEPRNRIDEHE